MLEIIFLACIVVIAVVLIKFLIPHKTNGPLTIYRFTRPSCPFCVDSQSEWAKFKSQHLNDVITVDVNLDSNTAESKYLANTFYITTVPTVIAKDVNSKRTIYNGDRTALDYNKWVTSLL